MRAKNEIVIKETREIGQFVKIKDTKASIKNI